MKRILQEKIINNHLYIFHNQIANFVSFFFGNLKFFCYFRCLSRIYFGPSFIPQLIKLAKNVVKKSTRVRIWTGYLRIMWYSGSMVFTYYIPLVPSISWMENQYILINFIIGTYLLRQWKYLHYYIVELVGL